MKVVDATLSGEQDHELAPYVPLMEDNPRSLKRLRNAVTQARAGRLTGGEVLTKPADLDGLIRWTTQDGSGEAANAGGRA